MDFTELESFKIIAETGSLTKAARLLHVTQPAMSAMLKKFEEELGVELFDRSPNRIYLNTDIFAAKIDGTNLVQLTYHAADDLSPVWSKNGKYIYFISQRGSADGTANIWRMNFNY